MKNKLHSLLLMLMISVLALTACTTNDTKQQEQPNSQDNSEKTVETTFPLTVTDAIGNEITLDAKPTSIVSMMPSNTEILFALGLDDEIVGVSDYDDYPEQATTKEKIGGLEFNVEKIVAMNPDLVLAHESGLGMGEAGLQQIRDAGITVFVVKNAGNFDETYATIETISKLTNTQEQAQRIIEDMKAKVAEVVEKTKGVVEKKKVFIENSPAPEIYTPGNNTFMQQMLEMIGAENIAADQEGWVMLDPESIISRNPDVIVVMYDFIETAVEDVYARDGFAAVRAIQEEQVVQVDENITSRTGPRLADGFEQLAKAVYPEVFGE